MGANGSVLVAQAGDVAWSGSIGRRPVTRSGVRDREVVDASHLMARALEIGDRLAGLSRQGIALQKPIVDSWIRIPFDESVRGGVRVAAVAFESGEHRETIKRFLERKR